MQWLGVGSIHAQRVDASVSLPPARVDHAVLVWPWRRYVARPRRCPPSGRLFKSKACLGFGCGGRCRHHCQLKRWGVQRTRRQRCGFLTLLAADCAPVTALAVGLETNVGRRKGKRRAKRVAAEAFVRKTGRSPGSFSGTGRRRRFAAVEARPRRRAGVAEKCNGLALEVPTLSAWPSPCLCRRRGSITRFWCGRGAATWRGLQVASPHGRRRNWLSLNSLSGRCESALTAAAAGVAAPRRQRCGFPTMLAADFAPVPALAVGLETNVGRKRQAPRQARRG